MHRATLKLESCQTLFGRLKPFNFQLYAATALSSISLVYAGEADAWPPTSFNLARPCDAHPRYAEVQA